MTLEELSEKLKIRSPNRETMLREIHMALPVLSDSRLAQLHWMMLRIVTESIGDDQPISRSSHGEMFRRSVDQVAVAVRATGRFSSVDKSDQNAHVG